MRRIFILFVLLLLLCSTLLLMYTASIVDSSENTDNNLRGNENVKLSLYEQEYYKLNNQFNQIYDYYLKCYNETHRITCGREGYKKPEGHKFQEHDSYTCGWPIEYIPVVETTRECTSETQIRMGISIAPNAFLRRIVTRKIYKDTPPLYFMGLSRNETINEMVKQEAEIYNDIIQFNYLSSYWNLTTQIIMEMRWVSEHCSNYRYYMHQLDDTFYNVKKFREMFIGDDKPDYDIIAFRYAGNQVVRRKKSIYYLPTELYSKRYYPEQPSGPAYILNHRVLPIIAQGTREYNFTLIYDDAYMGLLLEYVNLKITGIDKYVDSFFHAKDETPYSVNITNMIYLHSVNEYEHYLLSTLV